jgi:hypothetical protein
MRFSLGEILALWVTISLVGWLLQQLLQALWWARNPARAREPVGPASTLSRSWPAPHACTGAMLMPVVFPMFSHQSTSKFWIFGSSTIFGTAFSHVAENSHVPSGTDVGRSEMGRLLSNLSENSNSPHLTDNGLIDLGKKAGIGRTTL